MSATLASTTQPPYSALKRTSLALSGTDPVQWSSQNYIDFRSNLLETQKRIGASPVLHLSPSLSVDTANTTGTIVHNIGSGIGNGTIVNGNYNSVVVNERFSFASASLQSIAVNNKFDSASWTWIVLFKVASKDANQVFINNQGGSAGSKLGWNATVGFQFAVANGIGYNNTITSASSWDVASWQALIATKTGTTMELYHYQNLTTLVLLGTNSGSIGNFVSNLNISIGGITDNYVNGLMGDTFIFDTVTTAENYQEFLDFLKLGYQ